MRSFNLPGICEKFDQTRFKTLATAVESGRDFIENEGLIERAQALGCRPRQASAVDLGDIPIDEENVIKHGLSLGSKAAFCASNKKPDRSMNSPEMKMLIRREFGKEIAIRTISTYMKRWNMTPQLPKKKAHGPRGQSPVLIDNARTNYGAPVMISAVNNQGKCFFLLQRKAVNACHFIRFLHRLILDLGSGGRKLFVICDNARIHHARLVQRMLYCLIQYGFRRASSPRHPPWLLEALRRRYRSLHARVRPCARPKGRSAGVPHLLRPPDR